MSDYRNLKVWYQTLDFVARVYEITSEFPAREQYGLTSQIRRAATSIALNIAEGATSGYNSEYARFLRIAIRSANEVSAGFEIAKRLKFCSSEDAQSQINAADHIAARLCPEFSVNSGRLLDSCFDSADFAKIYRNKVAQSSDIRHPDPTSCNLL